MELSSDRVVATLEMSQTKGKEDEAVNVDGDYESLPPHVSVMTHMTAGAVAGILEHTVMYPVDSVKVTHTETPELQTTLVLLPEALRGYSALLSGQTACYRLLTTVSCKMLKLPS